jgi:hypothetical protein
LWSVASAGVSALVGVLLLLPGLLYGASQDAAVYASVAVRLRAGAALYAGAWDHKPPGAYLIDVAAQSALPWLGPWVPIWLVSCLAVVACALVVDAVLRRSGQSRRIGVAGALFVAVALALPPVAQGGGHTEPFALVPAAAAFGLAAFGSRHRAFIGAGILLGLALIVSLQLAPAVVAVAAMVWMRGQRNIRLGCIAVGFAVPLVLTATLLAGAGLLPEAWDAVVRYSAAYRAMNLAVQGPTFAAALRAGILASAVALIPIGLAIMGSLRASGRVRGVAIGCVTWLAAGAAWIAFQGRLEGHYMAPLVVPAGILFALGLPRLVDPSVGRLRATLLFGVPLVVLGALSAVVVVGASKLVWDELATENHSARAVANVIASGSSGSETVFVWGNRPQVYYLADRAPASRYLYLAPLTTPGYSSPAQIAEVLVTWEQAPPAFIVDAGSREPGAPGLPPLLLPRPISANGRDYDVLEPMRDFVQEHYALLGIVEGWPVYELTVRETRR